ncbi:hypothetical protein F0562_033668 [Nyssa sinensis]|uniref:N-acetyltransferase domain-containing protein n=1 Tax=Nyssa sinensis TaxID=561372 RepID=A0A5J5AEZ4_9ASTE|nr:hypothetical protein F0562_033668 [Nyssa sinensis]
MATARSLSFTLQPQPPYSTALFKPHQTPFLTSPHTHPLVNFPKSNHYNLTLSCCTSHSSSSSSTSSILEDPLRTGRFLTNEELEKLQFLEDYRYYQELKSGSMWVRVMKADEMDMTAGLLSESFAESMMLPKAYESVLGFLVKQYLIERRTLMPYTATLIGFYREDEEENLQLAGTVEVCFDKRGANASLPTPTPPKNSPYICNMTVKKTLRRRGIGWHLLKASEELICQMRSSREVYLHCRMIDAAPFNMYMKAGYTVVKTDSILILLTLQRRKHLMCKKFPVLNSPSEIYISNPNEELPS